MVVCHVCSALISTLGANYQDQFQSDFNSSASKNTSAILDLSRIVKLLSKIQKPHFFIFSRVHTRPWKPGKPGNLSSTRKTRRKPGNWTMTRKFVKKGPKTTRKFVFKLQNPKFSPVALRFCSSTWHLSKNFACGAHNSDFVSNLNKFSKFSPTALVF